EDCIRDFHVTGVQTCALPIYNGEINTITANRNWAMARVSKFENPLLPGLTELNPIVNRTGSDSSSLDNMLEILVGGGMDLFRARSEERREGKSVVVDGRRSIE